MPYNGRRGRRPTGEWLASPVVAEYRQQRFARPPGACELLLVRHGESEAARPEAPFPLVEGHGDPALHPNGRAQAEAVGRRLAGAGVSAIYVSNLRRTAETAAPLAEAIGVTPVVDPDLREVHLGEWEGGAFRRHVAEGHPAALTMLAEERWDAIPGGESNASLTARTTAAVRRIAAAHPDQVVVVVSHGGAIGAVLAAATGSRPFAFTGADNASISHLVVAGERWVLRRYNDTGHLDDAFASMPQAPT